MTEKTHLGIDLDGVIADWLKSYTEHANKLKGRPVIHTNQDQISSFKIPAWYQSQEEYDRVYQSWLDQENPYLRIDDINPQDTQYLSIMNNAKSHEFDVSFITARDESRGYSVEEQTRAWLQFRGVYDPDIYVRKDKGRVCRALGIDYMLDDRVDNLEDVVKHSSSTTPVLFNRSYNKAGLANGYRGVDSMVEFFDYVRNDVSRLKRSKTSNVRSENE